jgi:dephospho-CoA kinase
MKTLSESEFANLLKSRCIGLTGGIATGKSTVAKFLSEMGCAVIDADQLAREVVLPGEPALAAIINRFGSSVINPDHTLNRNKLRDIVMSDPGERRALEAITHPAIQKKFREMAGKISLSNTSDPIFYEAALLFETGRDGFFREIWVTTCPENLQLKRLTERSGLSMEDARKILASQIPAADKAAKATRVIDTNCSIDELNAKITSLVKGLQ